MRVQRLLRSQSSEATEVLQSFDFEDGGSIDFDAFEIVTHAGEAQRISKRESQLLRLLISKAGQVVSREEILEVVWGYHAFPNTRTIDNHIVTFRNTLKRTQKPGPLYLRPGCWLQIQRRLIN